MSDTDTRQPFADDAFVRVPVVCEWFALCGYEASGTVAHPILGPVPTCATCATNHDLALVPFKS